MDFGSETAGLMRGGARMTRVDSNIGVSGPSVVNQSPTEQNHRQAWLREMERAQMSGWFLTSDEQESRSLVARPTHGGDRLGVPTGNGTLRTSPVIDKN